MKEMATCEKVIFLKFKNREGFIYDTDWIVGVEDENKNEN